MALGPSKKGHQFEHFSCF